MNEIEYFDLQSKIKTHFTWKRTQNAFWPNMVTLILVSIFMVLVIDLLTVKVDKVVLSGLSKKLSLFVLLIAVGRILMEFVLSRKQEKILDALDLAYSRNLTIKQVMYWPEFKQFFPRDGFELTYKGKPEDVYREFKK